MLLLNLGTINYSHALALQKAVVERKISLGGPDLLIILEHPHTVTLGVRGSDSDLLVSRETLSQKNIEIYSVDRGGEATYHGPGQLICYPIMNLRTKQLSVRNYVHALEQTILETLDTFGVKGFRQPGKAGVWTGKNSKIASIGVKIRQRVSYHGFSLNVNLEVDPSGFVVCCGMPQVQMISLNKIVSIDVDMSMVQKALVEAFSNVFRVCLRPCSIQDLAKAYQILLDEKIFSLVVS